MIVTTATAVCDDEICQVYLALNPNSVQPFRDLVDKGWTIPIVVIDTADGIGHAVQKTFCPEHGK